jgi:predicted small secreted protein
MKRHICWSLFVICSLAITCNTVNALAQSIMQPGDKIQNGIPISKLQSGETIYYEPDHVALPEPQFYNS